MPKVIKSDNLMLCRAVRKLLSIKATIKYRFQQKKKWLVVQPLPFSLTLSLSTLFNWKIILHFSNGVLSKTQHVANTTVIQTDCRDRDRAPSNAYKILCSAHHFLSFFSWIFCKAHLKEQAWPGSLCSVPFVNSAELWRTSPKLMLLPWRKRKKE